MSGTLYSSWKDALGVSHIDEPVAVYENGKIYAAADGFLGTIAKGTLIGEYENGNIYDMRRSFGSPRRNHLVGVYEGGTIYSVSNNVFGGVARSLSVGECTGGRVYSHSHKIMEGSESFGLYNGDDEGAAAAATIALFKLESNVSAYGNSHKSRSSSDDDEDLWEKYGLFMPVVVTYRLFKYAFIALKWIFGIIGWLILLITKAIQKHKEKRALEVNVSTEDVSAETTVLETEIEPDESEFDETDANSSAEMPLYETEDVLSEKFATEETTDVKYVDETKKEEIIDTSHRETEEFVVDEVEEIKEEKPEASTSRLKSTMRTHASEELVEKSDKFRIAGDL